MASKSNVKISDTGLEIIKFSKGIQVQARNNRGTRYLNYKLLIRKIRWVFEQEEEENFAEAQRYDLIFKDILLRDMNRMDSMYNRDINYIRDLMCIISKDIWSMSIPSQSNRCSSIKTKKTNDTNNASSMFISSLSSLINPNFGLVNERKIIYWLHNLLECCGKLAKLRSYIIWNSIAVIKVLRKRKKKISASRSMKNPIDAYTLLNGHEFYKGLALEYLNKNFRNIMVKVFKKDMFSEVCQRCNKKTFEPIKSICNHIFCWKCIISVDETLIVKDSSSTFNENKMGNSNDDHKNCMRDPFIEDYLMELNSYFKYENEETAPTGDEYDNRTNFKRIRNKPFKNCPICHSKWSRNPASLQVENKLIRLCIQEYKNNNFLTGISELDTIVQSSTSNVGFISSDEESEEESFSETVAHFTASVNDEHEANGYSCEHNKINRFGGLSYKTVLSPSNDFESPFSSAFHRPQSSTLSTMTPSNNSTDDSASDPSSKPCYNFNSTSVVDSCNFNQEFEFFGSNNSNLTRKSNSTYSDNIHGCRNFHRNGYNPKHGFSNHQFLNNRKLYNGEYEGSNFRQKSDLNNVYIVGNNLRHNISVSNCYQNKNIQKRNYHRQQHQNKTSYKTADHLRQSWNKNTNNSTFVGINSFVRSNEDDTYYQVNNKNRSFFLNGNLSKNRNDSASFNFQNLNDNIWSNGYHNTIDGDSTSIINNNSLVLNLNDSHSMDLNVNSSDEFKCIPPLTPYSYQGPSKDCDIRGDRLWEPPNIQRKFDNKREKGTDFIRSRNETNLGTNFGIFLNDNFNNDPSNYRIGNDAINYTFPEMYCNLNEDIVSLDSKLLELLNGLGA